MTIIRRKRADGSTAYGVSIHDPDSGAQKWVGTFDTRSEASDAEECAGAPGSLHTFDAFADEWVRRRKAYVKPSTADNYRFYLRRARDAFGGKRLSAITKDDLDAFAADITDELAPLTARCTIGLVRTVLMDAATYGFCRMPAKMRRPKADRQHAIVPLTKAEHARLLKVAGHYKTILALWPLVGLRPGEMFALKECDITASGLRVDRKIVRGVVGPPKYGSSRLVPLTPDARALLEAHELTPSLKGWLFTTPQGSNLDTANFCGGEWQEIRLAAGLPSLRLHDLRHTFASRCLAGGLDVRTLAEYLGHKSAKVTLDTYSHFIPKADEGGRLEAVLASS